MKIALAAALLGPLLTVAASAPAAADTPGCASHGEVDNLFRGLSTSQVAGRLDTNGWYIGSGENYFRRGYAVCWDDNRKLVAWYSLDNGLLADWDVRDM